jgi:NADPH-dependent glutamate synthase beta subunit-like oxidoreductase/NAD(P)H-flavin reductase
MPYATAQLKLKDAHFQDLFTAAGLAQLDERFLTCLEGQDSELAALLKHYRHCDEDFTNDPKQYSLFLLDLAPYIERFVIELFAIEDAAEGMRAAVVDQDPIFIFKNHFVLRLAKRLLKKADTLESFEALHQWLQSQCSTTDDPELSIARFANQLLQNSAENAESIDRLAAWCVQAISSDQGQRFVKGWVSFKFPQKLNFENLVGIEPVVDDPVGRLQGPPQNYRQRDGFKLTDNRMGRREVLNEIDYCVYCHKNDGDFCSKGFPVKKNNPDLGLKINPVGDTLTGCPLEEKISEMQTLKKQGLNIAALAMVMLDNPMCPATGHRICNDCMKGCIYQKQDPVNIPEVETRILTDVLGLPWGVEIYDLLTRWNPLRQQQYVMKPYNGSKVLVMGMGPAGFTMAHHLLMEGFAVVGADGLKIEPLNEDYVNQPIFDYQDLVEGLDNRLMAGFGGVAEYGITVRWDKNFLKLIYITLMRRRHFQVFGGVRFGGALTIDEAWRLGFDHITLAVGAGLPKELPIPNSLAPGMRQANDFLMALQLTGAAKETSLANLQVRLPAVVIGGGLTGVDTATEIQAYYIKQVEKTLFRYETLVQQSSEENIRATFSGLDLEVLDEFCKHGLIVRQERRLALQEKRQPDFIKLIREWGGVTIVYRRSMQESPAYQRNHEELIKAFEEGIYYVEGLEPNAVELDQHGNCSTLRCLSRFQDKEGKWMATDEVMTLPARSIFVATGAKPNVAYAFEHAQDIERKKFEYPRYSEVDGELTAVEETGHIKMPEYGAFTSYSNERKFVSFIGDTHPIFHGSVVKAIASAKRSYPRIVNALSHKAQSGDEQEYQQFNKKLNDIFNVTVELVEQLDKNAIRLVVRAPQLARQFKPGQFYRLQNYEAYSSHLSEAVACLGAKDEKHDDCLSFILMNNGVSSEILMSSQPGDRLAMMGPTGVRSAIPDNNETILVIGGRLAIAYLLSIAPSFKAAGNRVYFVGLFEKDEQVLCQKDLEANTDGVCYTSTDKLSHTLMTFSDKFSFDLNALDQVTVIGNGDLLRLVQKLRQNELHGEFKPTAAFKASVYGPMQCMLKGVCAQCLQWQIDPKTGKRTKAVYACSWQHQPLEIIDTHSLDDRLAQNHMQEQLTRLWYSSI